MRQLVGLPCVLCGERISSIIDGQFCGSCGCPTHTKCVQPTPADPLRCKACGAPAKQAEQEQALHKSYAHKREESGADGSWRERTVRLRFGIGIVLFFFMTVSAFRSTVNPQPDRRMLNTTPTLGFDLFLPIGLIGIMFCMYRVARGR